MSKDDNTLRNDPVNAFVPHSPPNIQGRQSGPLSGLRFAVKDLYDIESYTTGGGSPEWLATHGPAKSTATIVQKLLDAGASMHGKTICDELFYSFTGANAHYGTPQNVRAPGRMPGGSSSGSAAATAAGLCEFAIGSDTGGSIRVPASFCGIYGLRPTHGRIDLSHAMAMAPSFDTAGWLADDAEIFYKVGAVLLDTPSCSHSIEKILIADFAFAHADAGISDVLQDFLEASADALPNVSRLVTPPGDLDMDKARETFRVIQAYETWETFGAWIDANLPRFGPGIKERFAAAKTVSRSEHDIAQKYQVLVSDALRDLLTTGTVLCFPTVASFSPLLNTSNEELEVFRRKSMALICLSSLAGLPQISIPAALSNGLPVGLSFMAWKGGDESLLELAVGLNSYIELPAGQSK